MLEKFRNGINFSPPQTVRVQTQSGWWQHCHFPLSCCQIFRSIGVPKTFASFPDQTCLCYHQIWCSFLFGILHWRCWANPYCFSLSWPPSALHFLVPVSPLCLSLFCLTLQKISHEGGSHLKVQPNVSNRGRDVPEEEHSLSHSLSNTSFSLWPPLSSSSSSVYHFSTPSRGFLSDFLRLAANNCGVVWYHRMPEGVEAAEQLSGKPKHLYSVIHLIVIPQPSIPLPSASRSVIHLALIFLPVCQRGSAKISVARGGACIWCVCER